MLAPLLLAAVPFAPGEWIHYRVALGPAEGGSATLAIAAVARQGRRDLLPARGTATPNALVGSFFPVRAEVVSWIDPATLLPARTEIDRGESRAAVHVRASQSAPGRVVFETTRVGGKPPRTQERRVKGPVHDPVSALLWLRANAPAPGEKVELTVMVGTRLVRVEIAGGPVETVALPVGEMRARRLDGAASTPAAAASRPGRAGAGGRVRRFHLWLSDDAARIPVKLDADTRFGRAIVEITGFGREDAASPRPAKTKRAAPARKPTASWPCTPRCGPSG